MVPQKTAALCNNIMFHRKVADCPRRITVSLVSIVPTLLYPSYTDIASGKYVINFEYLSTLIFLYNKK